MSGSMRFLLHDAITRRTAAHYVQGQEVSPKAPLEVLIRPYKRNRTVEQNRLQRLWLKEAEEQGDQTAEDYRGFCKLHLGVPILRADSDEFREKYDRIIRPFDYETKLELMMVPMDFPVTRLMTTSQKARYLDAMYRHFTGRGMTLTVPNWAEGAWRT